ncbi:MAG: glutathione S-transferase N-terminal domain-containing protein [Oleibacter sp.]|nr:glutathione S-transferase N-terminal domain-containing protein [Thalassolituus sp.]
MTIIRWVLGRIILLLDFLTSPKPAHHSQEVQAKLDARTAKLTLYHFQACPFCVKVRRVMRANNLNIETRDTKRSAHAAKELLAGGGTPKVPCLKIENDGETKWLYESSDIVAYLNTTVMA